MSAFWHPFADMGTVSRQQFTVTKADGVWIENEKGDRFLDATANLWSVNAGHGRVEIADAVNEQMRKLDVYCTFNDYTNEPAERLSERIAALAPEPESKVFLGSGGGDMIDTAAKIARAHFTQNGQPGKQVIIGRTSGYHGTHGFGTSIGGIEANQTGFGQLVTTTAHVPFDSAEALDAEIRRIGAENVAAFFCEPVMGAGGVNLPTDGYIERVAEICREHNVLFVADCVICGFGRLGTWLGIDRWDVSPDMIVLAKGITGGTLPLGALIVTPTVAEPFFGDPGGPVLRHGPTYAGQPVCCAAAIAALDLYERDRLIERGRTLEGDLHRALLSVKDHPLVGAVRGGLGLLGAVELTAETLANIPGAAMKLTEAVRKRGVIVRPLLRAVAVSPPLTIEPEEIELIATTLAQGLDDIA